MFATEQVLSPGQTYTGRILVVEDEALLAEEIRERLSRAGYTIVGVVNSAADAVTAVGALRPDLVLMDIRLKGSDDGTVAAATIQQRSDAAVVFLTAHSDTDTIVRATKTGPFGYVLKPFRERDLVVAIETALTRRRFEQQLIASERNYAAILASIGEGVVATDSEGRVTFMNRVAESLTGRQLAQARGEAVETVLHLVAEATGDAIESPGAPRDAREGHRDAPGSDDARRRGRKPHAGRRQRRADPRRAGWAVWLGDGVSRQP